MRPGTHGQISGWHKWVYTDALLLSFPRGRNHADGEPKVSQQQSRPTLINLRVSALLLELVAILARWRQGEYMLESE